MNEKLGYMVLSFVVLSTAILATYGGLAQLPDATAQNVTTSANQTAAPGQNQTTGPFGNLTTAWLDPLRGSFASARDALHENNTLEAYQSLGLADIQLFSIASEPTAGTQMSTLVEEFKPVSDRIGSAQDALLGNDVNKALDELNALDLELFRLNQQLPPAEP